MKRCVEREWLDELPVTDAGAQGSRRDLTRLNAWMGNPRIVERAMRSFPTGAQPVRLLELGAGDGDFMLRVARRLGRCLGAAEATLVDRHNLLTQETIGRFRTLGWHVQVREQDVFDWCRDDPAGPFDVAIANLFLHHFSSEQLKQLFKAIKQRCALFIAVEPRRSHLALLFSNLIGLIGCNAVTRHDAPVSVRAGFAGEDLSLLWNQKDGWVLNEQRVWPFSHVFAAKRKTARDADAQISGATAHAATVQLRQQEFHRSRFLPLLYGTALPGTRPAQSEYLR